MDSLKNFFDFLNEMNKETPSVLSFSKENLISEKSQEFEDYKLITKVYKTGNTSVTVETKVFNDKPSTIWEEAIQSVIDDLNEQLNWAVSQEKYELAAELQRKKEYLISKL
jgi:protein-arginine kinase activator protein McsA